MAHHAPRPALFLLLLQVQQLLLLVCTFVNNLTAAAVPSVPCLADQEAALLRLKRSFATTKNSTTTFRSWRVGTDCCRWLGVRCGHGTGRVTSLDLGGRRMLSSALDPAIFSLTSLRYLNLAHNNFNESELPSTGFERLTKLTHLNLSTCNFGGRIPSSMGHLTSLISFDLSTAYITYSVGCRYGTVLDVSDETSTHLVVPNFETLIRNLENLRELRLDYADMSPSDAEWCDAITKHTPNLRVLSLAWCSLSSPICGSFSGLHSLAVLDLQINELYGPVPDLFANLSSLRVLQLSLNVFEGWFPSIILQQKNLVTIDISHNKGISGILPNFSADSSLENFLVGNTNFSGKIPSSISNLKSLKKLDLAATGFSGTIPSSIGWLKSLDLLAFSGFKLVGSIPSWITNLTSLTVLSFTRCSLSGSIPSFVGELRELRELTLSYCKFYGNIPSFISNLTQIVTLNLESNNLVGTTEISLFWNLPDLHLLSLSNNQLEVVDTEDNSSLVYPRIEYISLASCRISKFPEVLRHFDEIYGLDLSYNQIGGAIPQWALEHFSGKMFFFLNLSHNKFTNIGFELFRPHYVMFFDLSFNMFEGPIPLPQESGVVLDYSNNMFSSIPLDSSTQLQYTVIFRASTNNLSGGISGFFCTRPLLEILDLSYNNLSGSIPSCLMEDTNALLVLNLKTNKLCGELSHNINESCTLQILQLGDNGIKGQLPRSLAACKNLEVIDIGNNQISDSFPCWMNTLARLQILVLKSNRFLGQMEHYTTKDMKSCEFPCLRILDIASNNFSGSLSESWFKRLNYMVAKTANETMTMEYTSLTQVYQMATIITYKGFDVSISNILGSLVFIDISNNAFHGSIPDAIGELVLLNVLNLSHNSFTGPIPSLLGQLKLLEALDLSSNELSGEIPQELASLDFLTTLNLSYNNLLGRIPESAHFMTFTNNSFFGNDGLCGPPLSKECINTTTSSVVTHHSKKQPVDIVLFLFAGLGFGIGFSVTIVVTWAGYPH
ncbi:hypothetical protein EJB05_31375, partial [Eragrostis curvula]